MFKTTRTKQFKKDYKLAERRGKNLGALKIVVKKIVDRSPLEEIYKDHALIGKMKNFRELHIENDWLLVYEVDEKNEIINLARLGTHSDIFK